MSKKKQIDNLAAFIGLKAAHKILIKVTNKPESTPHLKKEVDTYTDLSFDLANGNWNSDDIEKIKKRAKNKCSKKLKKYIDINDEKYNEVNDMISDIMVDLGLI